MFTELQNKVYDYVMDDTVRKENFTDIEICCMDDNEDANEEVINIISKMSDEDCIGYLKSEDEIK